MAFRPAPKAAPKGGAHPRADAGAFLPPTEAFAAETATMLAPSESHPRRQTSATPKQAKRAAKPKTSGKAY